jgi:hypothetical protein
LPFLNRVIADGIAIATFNAEPESFRGMVDAVAKHAKDLFRFSMDLASGSHESIQATEQISRNLISQFQLTESEENRGEERAQTAGRPLTSGILRDLAGVLRKKIHPGRKKLELVALRVLHERI